MILILSTHAWKYPTKHVYIPGNFELIFSLRLNLNETSHHLGSVRADVYDPLSQVFSISDVQRHICCTSSGTSVYSSRAIHSTLQQIFGGSDGHCCRITRSIFPYSLICSFSSYSSGSDLGSFFSLLSLLSIVHDLISFSSCFFSLQNGLRVRFEGKSKDLMHTATLLLTTNVSSTVIPLYAYHGRLNVTVPSSYGSGGVGGGLDFGVVSVNETKVRTLNISNPNPVKITLSRLTTNLNTLTVRLESLWNSQGYTIASTKQILYTSTDVKRPLTPVEENENEHEHESDESQGPSPSSAASRRELHNHTREFLLTLEPGHSAILSLELSTTQEEQREGNLTLQTPYEVLTIPLRYQSVKGRLSIEPKVIRFEEAAFPGRCVQQPIVIHSTYARPVHVTGVHTSDPRFVPIITQETILPSSTTQIGIVLFDPRQGSMADQFFLPYIEPLPTTPELTDNERTRLATLNEVWTRLQLRGETEVRYVSFLSSLSSSSPPFPLCRVLMYVLPPRSTAQVSHFTRTLQ